MTMALLTNFQLSVDSKWHFFLLLLHNTKPWAKAFWILRKEKKMRRSESGLVKKTRIFIPHRIHVWYIYIYTYIWLICMVNVAKYTIHGSYGYKMGLLRSQISTSLRSASLSATVTDAIGPPAELPDFRFSP